MRTADGLIYLDHHATTPVDQRVADLMVRYMTEWFGNPSSADHAFGDDAAEAVTNAAAEVAALLGVLPESVIFTSGATEAINLGLRGLAIRWRERGPLRVAVSPTEHSAVLDVCKALQREGLAVLRWLRVDQVGRVDLDDLSDACAAGTDVVCVMAANNEVGTIAPLDEVTAVAQHHGSLLFCDATQAAGRVPLDHPLFPIPMLVLSGHKMYGPRGVGAFVVSDPRLISPIMHGGGQQRGLRPGTLNVPAIAGLGLACRLRSNEWHGDEERIRQLRDWLEVELVRRVNGLAVNGDRSARLAGNLHVSFPHCPNEAIIARVRDRLAVATGSACSSGVPGPSHVLRAMGLEEWRLNGAIRIGVGKGTTAEDVAAACELLCEAHADALAVCRA